MIAHDRSSPASARPRRTAILGQGYVGLLLAIRAADADHRVVGFDTDDIRVKRLWAAQSPSPDIPGNQVAAALANGTHTPTANADDLAGFDVPASWDRCRTIMQAALHPMDGQ
ncbi:hypothetical protein [Streptomyces sp. NPDC056983]|uniref:hypothetical protein n=1 Tax=Streptomyces sp. NPDC056983 TaxID=3345987 RepID=UPI0036433A6B